jgi:2Fe-2S ferredoxin
MASIVVTNRKGETKSLPAADGASVMEIIRGSGFGDIAAICGGNCACATCHVYVDPRFAALVSPMGNDENDMLDSSDHRKADSRLTCQIIFNEALDGLALTIAPED